MRTAPTALVKAYYHPIEAAIRWCNLHHFELVILAQLGNRSRVDQNDFPRWPKLFLNSERIFCAMLNGELQYGIQGIDYHQPELIVDPAVTVGEAHLKSWMMLNYPEEKPRFLFNVTERKGMSRATVQHLLSENHALTANLNECTQQQGQLRESLATLKQQLRQFKQLLLPSEQPSERSTATYLNIIGGLLGVLRGTSPGGQRLSVLNSDAAIIDMLIAFHGERVGISERTLQKHFAAARRHLGT